MCMTFPSATSPFPPSSAAHTPTLAGSFFLVLSFIQRQTERAGAGVGGGCCWWDLGAEAMKPSFSELV